MKLLLCLLPLFLFLFVNIANVESTTTEKSSDNGGVTTEISNNGDVREESSTSESSDNEDSDVNTEENEDAEEYTDSPNTEPCEEDKDEGDDDSTIVLSKGTEVLLKWADKATSMFSNKSEEEILAIQKKLAELKYGFSRN